MPADHALHAAVFKALCDESRLRILELLQEGELCACSMTELLGIKQSVLSYHMKILVRSGIVTGTPVGKWMHYRISETGAQEALALLRTLTAVHSDSNAAYRCPE